MRALTGAASGLAQAFTTTGKVVHAFLKDFQDRSGPLLAAGLAFYFLLGLIPLLFIVAATGGYLLGRKPQVLTYLSTNLRELLPPGIGETLLQQIQQAAANWETFGLLGGISLILVATALFEALDEGINAVMGTRKKVGFLKGRVLSLAYLVGAVLYFSIAAVADYLFALTTTIPAFRPLAGLARLLSLGAFALFLFFLYLVLPVRTPKAPYALGVSVGVALTWSALQRLGTWITAGISRRQAIYGALAGAAVFLTWMYLLAFLILLGAHILARWGTKERSRTSAP